MFKINTRPSFTSTVQIAVPGDDTDVHSLNVRFKALRSSEMEAHDTGTSTEGQKVFLREVIEHVDGALDEDGEPVPYSEALREELLDWPFVVSALLQHYVRDLVKAHAGN
ncbi:MAG: hypothetical protein AAGM84_05620 [Pseudomonadota bacterium]